jgi:hypothetical protein
MWSGVFQQQINGRIWRYGQKHPVTVYHLIACGTTDIVMNGMASEKSTLMTALVKAGKNAVLETFREQDEEEAMMDSEEDSEAEARSKERKKPARSKKTAASTSTKSKKRTREDRDNEQEAGDLPGTSELRSPAAKKASRSKLGPHRGRSWDPVIISLFELQKNLQALTRK